MSAITLKSLHDYLKLLENPSEMKRRLADLSNPCTLKEGLYEMSRLVGVEESRFKDPQTLADLIGAQRLVMIWGTPSTTDQVARVFDNSRVLLSGLASATGSADTLTAGKRQEGGGSRQGGALARRDVERRRIMRNDEFEPHGETFASEAALAPSQPVRDEPLKDLKSLLAGNVRLTCKLFRALFEHMLGFAPPNDDPQSKVSLVNQLAGSREHSRSFLSTALFILGTESHRSSLMSFMIEHDLYGVSQFEHMLWNRDYCKAFYAYRRFERAFMGTSSEEEERLSARLDHFNAQFGAKPCRAKIFKSTDPSRTKVDAFLAAVDLLEALSLTPWRVCVNRAVTVDPSISFRSAGLIAGFFERFSQGEMTEPEVNREISEHLFAFARQFSADVQSESRTESKANTP